MNKKKQNEVWWSNAKIASSKEVLFFLLFHSVIFLGVGYILSYIWPLFTIFHSGFGIIIYIIFLRKILPNVFRTALLGAVISVLVGIFFGDWMLNNFYLDSLDTNILHSIYSVIVVFYIYLFINLFRLFISENK